MTHLITPFFWLLLKRLHRVSHFNPAGIALKAFFFRFSI
jgi:hypothetical protein